MRRTTNLETAIVKWMLVHASTAGDLRHLLPLADHLRVVHTCDCGCASVDFVEGGQALPYQPIAEARSLADDGCHMDVLIWGDAETISGLEVVNYREEECSLPAVETLRTWDTSSENA
jgi:hypothetical protein